MRLCSFAVLALLAAGCPTNDAPPAEGQPGAAGGVPPEGGEAGLPGPPPGDQAGAPAPTSELSTPAGAMMGPPGFASLIADGATVTISGTVTGYSPGDTVQVDFARVTENNGQKSPSAIEVVKVTDGKFSVKAPATLEGDIWVSAFVVDDKGAPGKRGGVVVKPIRLEGKDLTVAVAISKGEDWQKDLPWYTPGSLPPLPTGDSPGPGTPPGGGAPGEGAPGAAPAPGTTPAGGPPPGTAGGAPAGAAPAGG